MPPQKTALHCFSATSNFVRLVRLIIQGSKDLLRVKLDTIHAPANLPIVLEANRELLVSRNTGLSEEQQRKMFPLHGNYGSSSDFDLTMLIVLLIKVCGLPPPSTGWHRLPCVSDLSWEADLIRIRYYRNTIYGHLLDMEIGDSLFQFLWKEISSTLLRVACRVSADLETQWKETIDELKTHPLTTTYEECIRELILWYDYDVAAKESFIKEREQDEKNSSEREQALERVNIVTKQTSQAFNHETGKQDSDQTAKGHEGLDIAIVEMVEGRDSAIPGGVTVTDATKPTDSASTSKGAVFKSTKRSLDSSFNEAGGEGSNIKKEKLAAPTGLAQSDLEGNSELEEERTIRNAPIIKTEILHDKPTFTVEEGSFVPSISGSSRRHFGENLISAIDDLGRREDHIVVAKAYRGEGIECVLTWSASKNRLFRPIYNYSTHGWPNEKFQIGYKYRFTVIDENASLSQHPHKREDIFVREKLVKLPSEVRLGEEQLYALLDGVAYSSLDEVFAPGEVKDETYIIGGTNCPSAGALRCTTNGVRTYFESPRKNYNTVRWGCYVNKLNFPFTATNKDYLHQVLSGAREQRPPQGNILVLLGLARPRDDTNHRPCRILVTGIIFESPPVMS